MTETRKPSADLAVRVARLARDIEPSTDLWPAIAAEIRADSIRLDELTQRLPTDETPPPDVWPTIRSALDPRPVPRRHSHARTWALASLGLAAMLVVGIMIGRFTTGIDPGPNDLGSVAVIADAGSVERPMSTPYRIAADEHFEDAETLLVLFEGSAVGDAELARLARELAARSRMLIGSRVGDDAQVRAVLLDLELLLTQISRLVDDGNGMETQIVRDGVTDTDVLGRLRQLIAEDARVRGI
jgi:hypothetical protein